MAILKIKFNFGDFFGDFGALLGILGPKTGQKSICGQTKNTSRNSRMGTREPEMIVAHRRRRHHAYALLSEDDLFYKTIYKNRSRRFYKNIEAQYRQKLRTN